MKYKFELDIDAPHGLVLELMENPDHLPKWQPELTGHMLVSGERGKVGAQTRLTYRTSGRPLEITETITGRNPPHEFTATYVTSGVTNRVTNRFADIGAETTFWQFGAEVEFTNLFMKLVGMLMGNVFRDQSWRYMNLFKQFAEETYRQHPDG